MPPPHHPQCPLLLPHRMKDALTKMNDRSTNMCMYLICIVLIMGLGYLGYDLAKKKGIIR